jgi:hypothetical protein
MIPATSTAQGRGEAPLAPASAIGPTTAAPTISVLGMASSSNGGGSPLTQRGEYWLGATQPLGRFGNVRFNAIGHADVHSGDASGTNSAGEGMLALRARARFSGAQVWSAFSYGYVKSNGQFAPPNVNMGPAIGTGFDGVHVDTTVSQYVDVGSIQRAEAGVISNLSGVEFSFGLALDRISRVTERTLKFEESSQIPPTSMSATDGRTTVLRSLQRREIATGIASMGFYTGPATWLISVTSPLATRITSDASAPKARIAPTVASVAIMQPVTGWLSIVAAGATNSSSVGSTVFRDDVGATRHANFAPVVALGVRIGATAVLRQGRRHTERYPFVRKPHHRFRRLRISQPGRLCEHRRCAARHTARRVVDRRAEGRVGRVDGRRHAVDRAGHVAQSQWPLARRTQARAGSTSHHRAYGRRKVDRAAQPSDRERRLRHASGHDHRARRSLSDSVQEAGGVAKLPQRDQLNAIS